MSGEASMAIHFIDFENASSGGLSGIANLSNTDSVYVFYSKNQDKVPIDLIEPISSCKAKFKFIKVAVGGKHALDQQLSTFLGYLIGSTNEQEFVIVSKDKGFNYVLDFWAHDKPELNIKMAESLAHAKCNNAPKTNIVTQNAPKPAVNTNSSVKPAEAQPSPVTKAPAVKAPTAPQKQPAPTVAKTVKLKPVPTHDDIALALGKDADKPLIDQIFSYIKTAQTKAALYNLIRKKHGQDKGSSIYQKIKKWA